MPRPMKFRRVECFPKNSYFVPIGEQKCDIEEIVLNIEELEAMRLKDIEDLSQEECAEKMQISRQTFQNIINSGRKKVAIALTKGYAINIKGGHYVTNMCKFRCLNCGNIYEIKTSQDRKNCPACNSKNVICNKKQKFCHRWCGLHKR